MKTRKPKPIQQDGTFLGLYDCVITDGGYADVAGCALTVEEARRLSKWLLRFADWHEEKYPK